MAINARMLKPDGAPMYHAFMRFPTVRHVTFAWDAATDGNVVAYRLYYGVASGQYTGRIDVGNVTQYSIAGIPIFDANGARITYYAQVIGLNSSGQEIDAGSNEASLQALDVVGP